MEIVPTLAAGDSCSNYTCDSRNIWWWTSHEAHEASVSQLGAWLIISSVLCLTSRLHSLILGFPNYLWKF